MLSSNETLYVNLVGGPGTGKSTTSAEIFSALKKQKINAELISEYAKDKTWEGSHFHLGCQPYILSKQLFRQYRVLGKVDVAVTDTSILLGKLYPGFGSTPSFNDAVIEWFKLFNNLVIFLKRNPEIHPYNPRGRSQTEEEAIKLDHRTKELLVNYNIPYYEVEVSDNHTLDKCMELIIPRIPSLEVV